MEVDLVRILESLSLEHLDATLGRAIAEILSTVFTPVFNAAATVGSALGALVGWLAAPLSGHLASLEGAIPVTPDRVLWYSAPFAVSVLILLYYFFLIIGRIPVEDHTPHTSHRYTPRRTAEGQLEDPLASTLIFPFLAGIVFTILLGSAVAGILVALAMLLCGSVALGYNVDSGRFCIMKLRSPLDSHDEGLIEKTYLDEAEPYDVFYGVSVFGFIFPLLIALYLLGTVYAEIEHTILTYSALLLLYGALAATSDRYGGVFVETGVITGYALIFAGVVRNVSAADPVTLAKTVFAVLTLSIVLADLYHGVLLPALRGFPRSRAGVLGGASYSDAVVFIPLLTAGTVYVAASAADGGAGFVQSLAVVVPLTFGLYSIAVHVLGVTRRVVKASATALLLLAPVLIYLDSVTFTDFLVALAGGSTPGAERASLIVQLAVTSGLSVFVVVAVLAPVAESAFSVLAAVLNEVMIAAGRREPRKVEVLYGNADFLRKVEERESERYGEVLKEALGVEPARLKELDERIIAGACELVGVDPAFKGLIWWSMKVFGGVSVFRQAAGMRILQAVSEVFGYERTEDGRLIKNLLEEELWSYVLKLRVSGQQTAAQPIQGTEVEPPDTLKPETVAALELAERMARMAAVSGTVKTHVPAEWEVIQRFVSVRKPWLRLVRLSVAIKNISLLNPNRKRLEEELAKTREEFERWLESEEVREGASILVNVKKGLTGLLRRPVPVLKGAVRLR